ncbi:MAG: LysR family transcriptional regulator [Eubacteriales bacterium]|nr:LysR family transcriptional regulator [Eubacteriales bacterium]
MFSGMRYVYAVYQHKSFSKAAQALYISQPALSASVKKIEKELGMPLFDRSKNPIHLTECGEQYIAAARQIMRIEDEFSDYLNDLKNMMGGSLSIGASTFYAAALLPLILQTFSAAHPDVKIRLTEGSVQELETQLYDGELDFVIEANAFDEKLYEKVRIYHEHLVLAVPKNYLINTELQQYQITREDIKVRHHVTGGIEPVDLRLFQEEPFILLHEGNDIRVRADRILRDAGVKPHILLTLDHQQTAMNLAMRGMGITFVCDTLLNSLPEEFDDPCCYYKLDNRNIHRDVYFYHRKTKYMTPAMQAFNDLAGEYFKPMID